MGAVCASADVRTATVENLDIADEDVGSRINLHFQARVGKILCMNFCLTSTLWRVAN